MEHICVPTSALAGHYARRYALYRDMAKVMTPLRRLSAEGRFGSGETE
jgi:hypothetical protein